jgi:hypothetical protein
MTPRRTFASMLVLLAVLAWALLAAGRAGAAVTPIDPTVEGGQTYTAETESPLLVPAGVRSIRVHAVGGRGGTDWNESQPGGLAAAANAALSVTPSELLWVVVGGNASKNEGGFNGGAGRPFQGAALGGGGGGASDIRTVEPGQPGSLESRLLVAAGGGGAGGRGNGSSGLRLSAPGGNAGAAGGRAESGGANNTIGSGGFGGAAGQAASGGNGGEGGFPYSTGCGSHAGNGGAGGLGTGGIGGEGVASTPSGWGGGGGGGLYGGGGGGGGTMLTCSSGVLVLGGGGGGGGSSLVPPGGTVAVDNDSLSVPEISVQWRIPGTTMFGPDQYTPDTEPPLSLSSEEGGAEFECRIDSEEESAWEPCEAEPRIGPLADGPHRVEARAVNAEGNFDPSPATLEFIVDATPPVITSLIGPSVAEPTADAQPTFTFAATDLLPVHFSCGFDAPLGVCSGDGSARPDAPLAPGEHTFTLTPIDAAGNVGTPVVRAFTVVAPAVGGSGSSGGGGASPSSPPGSVAPTLLLGKVKLNAKKGAAAVLATVNGPGTIGVAGAQVKTGAVKASGAVTIPIPIAARGKALRQLRKTGKAKVVVDVTFTAAEGGTATASKTVALRWKQQARHPRPRG